MEKLRLREVRSLGQGHKPKWHSFIQNILVEHLLSSVLRETVVIPDRPALIPVGEIDR